VKLRAKLFHFKARLVLGVISNAVILVADQHLALWGGAARELRILLVMAIASGLCLGILAPLMVRARGIERVAAILLLIIPAFAAGHLIGWMLHDLFLAIIHTMSY
jgi:hypothetical protein